jgi:ABC-2 type transport system permease protein
MKKALNIAWKDLLLVARDPASLLILLATPFGLTLVMGFAFGGIGGGSSNAGLANIPVTIINQDRGQFGANLVQIFESQDLADLLEPVGLPSDAADADIEAAREAVDSDQSAAVVIVPDGFSESILPPQFLEGEFEQFQEPEPSVIEVYANPTRPVSVSVIRTIIDQFLNQTLAGIAGARISFGQLVQQQLVPISELEAIVRTQGEAAVQQVMDNSSVQIRKQSSEGQTDENGGFDWVAFSAPSMAILFLMFTVSSGSRNILAERDEGTLARMLVGPSSPAQILGGKILGIFITGLAQMGILILASMILLGLRWGEPLAVVVLVVCLVAAATSWGILLAAYARTPGQINAIGTALALTFGAGAGNFVPRQALPEWLQVASYVTPNAWGLEGFSNLATGGRLSDIGPNALALLSMAIILFLIALVAFRRQYA